MGYYISLRDQNFKRNIYKAVKAICSLDSGARYSWVESGFSKLKTIEELFDAWTFECERNCGGEIDRIEFFGEKSGDYDLLFKTIAPFVAKGSFLEWHGEDGEQWRYVFDGKTMKEIKAKIIWEEG